MDNEIPTPAPKEKVKRKKSSSKKSKDKPESNVEENAGDGGGEGVSEPEKRDSVVEDVVPVEPENVEPQREKSPSAMDVIGEILNPTLRIPETIGPYQVPEAVKAGDVEALRDLDVKKLAELKEVFTLFDSDADGFISEEDLKATFIAITTKEPPSSTIEQMLDEAMNPLDFDAFVVLMGYKTIELDPEEVLLEAWSKWDREGNGFILEEKIYHDLVTYGDRFSKREARDALEEAPLAKPKTIDEPPMIDYQAFCRTLSGLRKRKQQ